MDLSHWDLRELLTLEETAYLACGLDPTGHSILKTFQRSKIDLVLKSLNESFSIAHNHAVNSLRAGIEQPNAYEPDLFEYDHIHGELPSWELRWDFSEALSDPVNKPMPPLTEQRYPGQFNRDDLTFWFQEKGFKPLYDFERKYSSFGLESDDESSQHQNAFRNQTNTTFDKSCINYPPELDMALQAWCAVTATEGKGKPKARLRTWLDQNTKLSNEAKERIATVANWDKTGGATRTD